MAQGKFLCVLYIPVFIVFVTQVILFTVARFVVEYLVLKLFSLFYPVFFCLFDVCCRGSFCLGGVGGRAFIGLC